MLTSYSSSAAQTMQQRLIAIKLSKVQLLSLCHFGHCSGRSKHRALNENVLTSGVFATFGVNAQLGIKIKKKAEEQM